MLDTNVFVRALKASSYTNWNRRIVRLWLIERQLQFVVSQELIDEYLGIFADVLGMESETVAEWRNRFEIDGRSSLVNLARRYAASRDPDDNLLLATATAGEAKFLITNDRDLLEVSDAVKQTLKYAIVTPQEFFKHWDAE